MRSKLITEDILLRFRKKKIMLKFIWEYKKLQTVKAILSIKSKLKRLTALDFKTYYWAAIIKTAWY